MEIPLGRVSSQKPEDFFSKRKKRTQPPPQLEGKQVHKTDTEELTESQITIASRQKYELLVLVLPR
jgi:hypothetical protein